MWRFLTDTSLNQGGNGINSVQNGILLNSTFHDYWDHWAISINPVCLLLCHPLLSRTRYRSGGS